MPSTKIALRIHSQIVKFQDKEENVKVLTYGEEFFPFFIKSGDLTRSGFYGKIILPEKTINEHQLSNQSINDVFRVLYMSKSIATDITKRGSFELTTRPGLVANIDPVKSFDDIIKNYE